MIRNKFERVNVGWIILTVMMLISTDLLVVNLAGYPVVLTFALLPIWLFKSFAFRKTVRVKLLLFYLGLMIIPFINVGDILSWLEFIKAYLLLMMNAAILLFFCYSRRSKINRKTIRIGITIAQVLILVFTIAQIAELQLLGTDFLWSIWGDFSASHIVGYGGMRAKAFYHEPSHLALIAIFIFWMRYVAEGKMKLVNLLNTAIIIALCKSGAGLLLFPVVLVYFIVTHNRWFIGLPLLLVLALPVAFLIQDNQASVTKDLKINQMQDVDKVTSGYMRWILPVNILKSHLAEGRYFGYGLGQLENDYFRKVDKLIVAFNVKESAIANGLLSAQIQLGLFFTLFICYAFLYRYPKFNRNWRSFMFINFVCLTAGSYFMVEMYFIRFFIPILLLKSIAAELPNDNSKLRPA